ncbi:hypothetical protein L914_01767 [Phytophthora nicotianae]|uniref:Ubiquitin-like protease family profile domain-containing protein n=1 Tax=Phytophthora nicotianae TaxID=4792 RepID=W2P2C2_PHYNI|nr:hypothetical protein L914_01767 [Phytophthora nicotianae]
MSPIAELDKAQEFVYSMLYRVIPPSWLIDANIRGLCARLTTDFPTCKFSGVQEATTKSARAKDNEEVVTKLLLPLNFGNAHWCCVVEKVGAKRIFYYDSLNQKCYMRAAKGVATYLKHNGFNDFAVVPHNNPIQFDQYSCGVLVCWMFLRQVVPG